MSSKFELGNASPRVNLFLGALSLLASTLDIFSCQIMASLVSCRRLFFLGDATQMDVPVDGAHCDDRVQIDAHNS